MAKEFVKGVTVGEATAEENTQPAVSTVETNEEETKQVIRANEEDFIAGLIAAADFASDEEETQRISETTSSLLHSLSDLSAQRSTTSAVRNLQSMFVISSSASRCRRTQTVSSTSQQSSTRRLSQRIERSYGTTRRYGRRLKAKDFRLCPAWM